jgi:hypothetical protein
MRKLLLLPLTLPLAAARGAIQASVEAVLDALAGDLDPAPPPSPTRSQPAPPEPPIKLHDDEPTRGEVNRRRFEAREGSVGAEVHVDEPWNGYDEMSAPDVLDRLVGAGEATLAFVRLYERANRNRATVLRATG